MNSVPPERWHCFFVKRCEHLCAFSEKNRKCGNNACFHQKSLLCLHTVLLYRLTGKLINYYRKPSTLRIVQWRATPSGSFREPVDYKGQEPSNLVFSEFRRSFLTAKLFFVHKEGLPIGKPSLCWVVCLWSCCYLLMFRLFSACW